jgi:Putative Flp pilus-assembly TadE/G-like
MTRSTPGKRDGQVLALFAIFLVVLIGATAVTVDYGTWLKARRDYQNIADAAVLAGGGFLSRPVNATKRGQARHAAWDSLNAQLALGLSDAVIGGADPTIFTDGGLDSSNTLAGSPVVINGYRLWVSTPPIGSASRYPGIFTGNDDRYLFAWVEKENPSFFSHIFGIGDQTINAWATAGVFPSQFAVITLRKNGQSGPANATDIDLAGTNTILQVANGDVGGNWGMKLNSGSNLYLTGDADAYLIDYLSCGNSCWSANQVSNGPPTFTLEAPQELTNLIDDPSYPLPAALSGLPATGGTSLVPKATGTDNGPPASKIGDVTITKGTITGAGCSLTSPRIGPGWYHDIVVNGCVVLDPVHNYSDPNDANNDGDYGMTNLPATQQAGIFYITGTLNVGNNALVVGDGVSLVLRQTSNQPGMFVSGSGAVDVNTGASDGTKDFPPNMKKAAFQTDGFYSYTFNTTTSRWEYTADNNAKTPVGVAVYVVKPAQVGNLTPDANTNLVQIQAGAALSWQGVLYAPHDNITLSGQPLHDAIGQFICWTVKLAGGTTVIQTYDGPGEAAPRLVEPRLGE